MDIYEALKSGGNADTIMASFERELQAAVKRIEAEKAAAAQEEAKKRQTLASTRTALAEALKEYYTTLLGPDSETVKTIQVSDIEKHFKELEEEVKETIAALEQLATLFDKKPAKTPTPTEKKQETDDEVLANFLRTLI